MAKKVAPPTTAPLARAAAPKPAAKPAAKVAPPAAVKTAAAKAAKAVKAVKAAKPAKPVRDDKARKPKLVRDSFTIPKAEYAVLDALKARAAQSGAPAKKSELLRAGIKALQAMPDSAFLAALAAVPAIKTGRPAKA
ncbi:MAG: hypothetical protein EOO24_49050 [Comamonadaceae bacterium]|nr:MAG: hypothetical protein EOO24_49050 [Comamonadaceae bacterium]